MAGIEWKGDVDFFGFFILLYISIKFLKVKFKIINDFETSNILWHIFVL